MVLVNDQTTNLNLWLDDHQRYRQQVNPSDYTIAGEIGNEN
jgi:hypothetical protein